MIGPRSCVPVDRLTALALTADGPPVERDQDALDHVAVCEVCANRLGALTRELDDLRTAAWQETDAVFDDAALETQRARILDRLAHIGQAARVLRFPARAREAAMPVSPMSRRWLSVAAAAGLLIGLVAGQLIHFVPWDTRLHRSATPQLQNVASSTRSSAGPVIVQASSTILSASDEELLDEIDQAMQLRRAESLRALDAFTPRVGEPVEIR